ncbi:hypothetical protein PENANT_c006G09614 [Penicillium antarcticum]|uniref:Uncharacterized protein n=1 Tax=Penicillium antarcticum TaxID=416450 RepID=A0A1V6QDW7_9EURO|nr:hypothetical protein PENANT_c006G09614 [Penicillium antarcticum]
MYILRVHRLSLPETELGLALTSIDVDVEFYVFFPDTDTTGVSSSLVAGAPYLQANEALFEPQNGSVDAQTLEEQENDWGMLSTDEWKIKDSEQENCGLHNAIHVGIRENTTENMFWVETLGMPTDSVIEPTRAHIARNMQMIHDCLTVFVDDKTFEGHFNKFCRSVIWPALHYQMQAGPRHVDYTWDQYVKTNEAFADENIRRYRKGDNIWVSDYYLLLLPQILRSGLPRADIGFFLTTTFPSC